MGLGREGLPSVDFRMLNWNGLWAPGRVLGEEEDVRGKHVPSGKSVGRTAAVPVSRCDWVTLGDAG